MARKLKMSARPSGKYKVISPSGGSRTQPLNAWQIKRFREDGWKVKKLS